MSEVTIEDNAERKVTLQATAGVMFVAHVAYTREGMLRQATIFVNGLTEDAATRAINEYVTKSLKGEAPWTMSPVQMLPGYCAFISPKGDRL